MNSTSQELHRARALVGSCGHSTQTDLGFLHKLLVYRDPEAIAYLEGHLKACDLPSPWKMEASLLALLHNLALEITAWDAHNLAHPVPIASSDLLSLKTSRFAQGVTKLGYDLGNWYTEAWSATAVEQKWIPLWSRSSRGVYGSSLSIAATAFAAPELLQRYREWGENQTEGMSLDAQISLGVHPQNPELTWNLLCETQTHTLSLSCVSLVEVRESLQTFASNTNEELEEMEDEDW